MTVPEWEDGPPAPAPGRDGPSYPWVLDQRPGADGQMLVTFALPGLGRATISVPETVWLNGDHLAIGADLAATMILPPVKPDQQQGEADQGREVKDQD